MGMATFWTEQAAREVSERVGSFFFRSELRQTAEEILAFVRALADVTFDEDIVDDHDAVSKLQHVLPAHWHDLLAAVQQAACVEDEGGHERELLERLHPERVQAFAEAALDICGRRCGLIC
ncbi:MAG TPA: hypothetical protein VF260_12085 [Bacilli bacterium]